MTDPTPRELLADIDARRALAADAEFLADWFLTYGDTAKIIGGRKIGPDLSVIIAEALAKHAADLRAAAAADEARITVAP